MKKVLAMLLAATSILLVGCANDTDEEDENYDDYAVNEVQERTEPVEEDTTTTTEISTEPIETLPPYVPPEYTYNTTPDENKSKVLDLYEISIDGNMVKLPCTYKDIKDVFELSEIFDTRYTSGTIDVDEKSKRQEVNLYAYGKTGQGTICFTFTPKTGEYVADINNMICKKVHVSTDISTAGDKNRLMKFSLPGNITFGSEFNSLKDSYGYFDKSEMSDDGSCWNVVYTPVEDSNVTAIFEGLTDGLYSVSIFYK